jgi:hypothetical protein
MRMSEEDAVKLSKAAQKKANQSTGLNKAVYETMVETIAIMFGEGDPCFLIDMELDDFMNT